MGILSTEHGLDISRTSTLEYFPNGKNYKLNLFQILAEVKYRLRYDALLEFNGDTVKSQAVEHLKY